MNKKTIRFVTLIAIVFSTSVFSASNDLHKAVEDNDIKKINEMLIKDATLLKAFDEKGNTPIHKAIIEDKSASLQSFMEHKKVINMQITNSNGDTPLVFSIKNNKYNSISTILDNGINPFYKDKKDKNSLDYVKVFGDNITKRIYNEYYERNKGKIKALQENYKSPLDLSLFKTEEALVVKEAPKTTTVQDLLISNKKKRELNKDIADKVQVKEEKILEQEVINEDKVLVSGLENKLKDLEEKNKILKRQLRFKDNTGKKVLSRTDEIIIDSNYAGIYEQQVMFNNEMEDMKIDLFDQYTVINDTEDERKKNSAIDSLILKSNNYTIDRNNYLNSIEKEMLKNKDIMEIDDGKFDNKILLPISIIPKESVVVNSVEVEKDIIITTDERNNVESLVNKVSNIEVLKVMDKESPVITINRKEGTPEIKVEINKNKFMESGLMPFVVLFFIFLSFVITGLVILLRPTKKVSK